MHRMQDGHKHVCEGNRVAKYTVSCSDMVMFVVFHKKSPFVYLELSPLRKCVVFVLVLFLCLFVS